MGIVKRGLGVGLLLVATSLGAIGFPGDEVAALRKGLGLKPLLWNALLASTCQLRSQVLAQSGSLSHEDSEGRGPGVQLVAQGFPAALYGEVIGAGNDPEAVWEAWLTSSSHRRVLTDPRWTSWGWGASRSSTSTVWVLRFSGP